MTYDAAVARERAWSDAHDWKDGMDRKGWQIMMDGGQDAKLILVSRNLAGVKPPVVTGEMDCYAAFSAALAAGDTHTQLLRLLLPALKSVD